jgi:hypothetical protein
MNFSDWTWGLIGVLLSLMVLSYLIKDNFLFRLATQIFIGLTAGYFLVLVVWQILIPNLMIPLSSGTWIQHVWMILPVGLILFLLLGQVPRFSGFSRIPLAFILGITSAVIIIGAVFGTILPQSLMVINAFDQQVWFASPSQTWLKILDAVVVLVGVISVLSYFYFGRKLKRNTDEDEQKRPALFESLGRIGQVFIGMALGAIFAGIFSTALWALIERVSFITVWLQNLFKGL